MSLRGAEQENSARTHRPCGSCCQLQRNFRHKATSPGWQIGRQSVCPELRIPFGMTTRPIPSLASADLRRFASVCSGEPASRRMRAGGAVPTRPRMRAWPSNELACRLAAASASAVPRLAASDGTVMLKRARLTGRAAVQAACIAAASAIIWRAKSARVTGKGEALAWGGPTEARHQHARNAERMAKARLRPGSAHDLLGSRPPLNSQPGRKRPTGATVLPPAPAPEDRRVGAGKFL